MDKKCPFDSTAMQFRGTPLEQAQCLLRFPQQYGHVDDARATIPSKLISLLSNPDTIGFTKEMLRKALSKRGVSEANIGGSLDQPVSRANNNDPTKSLANYFVIHDTSGELPNTESFDSNFINTSKWTGNRLGNLSSGKTHIYITRDGFTKTDRDYQTPWRATLFEKPDIHKGRFLHHEMTQPRKFSNGYHSLAPDQGFTTIQYELLALCYFAASLRRGRWLIPALHCVLDLEIPDAHDDPQHFDLVTWNNAITTIFSEMANNATPSLLRSNFFKNDPALQKVVSSGLTVVATGGSVLGIGAVQDALNSLAASQSRPDFAIDLGGNRGSFGPRTEKAIIAFQRQHNLAQTGNINSVTLLTLDSLLP